MRTAPVLVLLSACSLFGGPKTPAAGPPVVKSEISLECTDSKLKWSSSYSSTKVDKCVYHEGDGFLEVRMGTLEGGLRVVAGDFQGTGQYPTGVNGGKVELTAKGGPESTPSTQLDSEGTDCKSQCTMDVASSTIKEAAMGETGLLTMVVTCPSLARKQGKRCVECKAAAEKILDVKDLPCIHQKD